MNMNTFILDACTLINLLRIDEDEILYKHLQTYNIKIAGTVFNEFKTNIYKNGYTSEMRDRIDRYLPSISLLVESDENIKNNNNSISNEYCERVQELTHHNKYDGELYSLLLSLYLSRCEMAHVNLYSDDKPAMDQFREYFMIQQLGILGDSIDLLLYMFCHSDKISEIDLGRFLENLKSEYNIRERNFVREIEEYRAKITNVRSRKNIVATLNSIIYNYRSKDFDKLYAAIEELESYHDNEIRQILRRCRPQPSSIPIVNRVNEIQQMLKRYNIFKLV